jgi:AcrR family transcriptional regulator
MTTSSSPLGATPGRLPSTPAVHRGADATREKLLQATHELLFERAGEEPSVSQICTRAGVQVAMVSYCFGGKSKLFDALLERLGATITEEYGRLDEVELAPEDKLRRHVSAYIHNYVRFPYATQLIERMNVGDATAQRLTSVFLRPPLELFHRIIADGVEQGTLRAVDPDLLAFSVAGMCEFLFTAASFRAVAGLHLDEALVTRYAEHTLDLLLHGLRA